MDREIIEGSIWRSHEGQEYEIVDVGEHFQPGQATVALQQTDDETMERIVDCEHFLSTYSSDEGLRTVEYLLTNTNIV